MKFRIRKHNNAWEIRWAQGLIAAFATHQQAIEHADRINHAARKRRH